MKPAAFIVFALLAISACNSLFGELGQPFPDGAGGTCVTAAACYDNNPCTVDSCDEDGACQHQPLQDDAIPMQTAGDCLVAFCNGGKLVQMDDDTDVPDDDNPCTEDVCDARHRAKNSAKEDGTSCADSGGNPGRCVRGSCEVDCTVGGPLDQCDDGKPCTIDACDAATGHCVHEAQSAVLAPNNEDGDCQLRICQAGVDVSTNDNGDLPVDNNQCTADICVQGIADNPALPAGTPCDQNGGQVCDGDSVAPACVQCVSAADCESIAPSGECRSWQCSASFSCVEQFTLSGTALMAQTSGDCQTLVCDGSGNSVTQVEPTDVFDDGLECTQDICNGMVPENNALPVNDPCGMSGALYCDGNGQCAGCNDPAQCGNDTFCQSFSCTAGSCVANNAPAGTDLPAAYQTANDCQVIECNSNGSPQSNPDPTDVPIDDGFECTDDVCSAGMVVHPPKPADTSCTQAGSVCDGMGNCVDCNSSAQCAQPPDCQTVSCTNHSCMVAPEPTTTVAPASYQTDFDCQVVMCDGMGAVSATPVPQGTDVPVDNNDCTNDVCSMGVATNPAIPAGMMCSQSGGQVCNGDVATPMCVECVSMAQCPIGDVCLASNMCCTPQSCADLGVTCGVHNNQCAGTVNCNGATNGSETDQDCGGNPAACPTRCTLGKSCLAGSDCLSGVCLLGLCV